MIAHGVRSAAPTHPGARVAGCKHTVALVNEELGPIYTSRAAEFAMEHACFRAVWMYRPTCAYMVGPLKTKLQLAIQQKRTPELTCAAPGYCGAAGSGPALANSTSNNNISISISIHINHTLALFTHSSIGTVCDEKTLYRSAYLLLTITPKPDLTS